MCATSEHIKESEIKFDSRQKILHWTAPFEPFAKVISWKTIWPFPTFVSINQKNHVVRTTHAPVLFAPVWSDHQNLSAYPGLKADYFQRIHCRNKRRRGKLPVKYWKCEILWKINTWKVWLSDGNGRMNREKYEFLMEMEDSSLGKVVLQPTWWRLETRIIGLWGGRILLRWSFELIYGPILVPILRPIFGPIYRPLFVSIYVWISGPIYVQILGPIYVWISGPIYGPISGSLLWPILELIHESILGST